MRSLLFEDPFVTELDPLVLARPAYSLSCGGFTLIEGLNQITDVAGVFVRPHLREVEEADRGLLPLSAPTREATLLVNARVVPSVATWKTFNDLAQRQAPCIVRAGDRISLAIVPAGTQIPDDPSKPEEYRQLLDTLNRLKLPETELEVSMLSHPHNIVAEHLLNFADGLEYRINSGDFHQLADGVFVEDPNTKLDALIKCDTSKGPILIESDVTIGPFTFLRGPLQIGANSIINEHSALKDNVSIGHHSKVGGEVEETVIEPFSNKQHHGFLGHSYIGSWVNLGAGTSNSDLKNTYGQIRMDYDSGRFDTGMQFLGCMVGDYTKSAINTSIFTGKVIGACSMLYGFITTNVPSFANYARTFGQITELPDEVLIDTQRRMFTRRRITQRPIDVKLIRDMYDLVKQKRQLVEERLAL